MDIITGLENVSSYWAVREEARVVRGFPGKCRVNKKALCT
jgi:hypothetical protein